MLGEVKRFLTRRDPSALNAGELSDALATDHLTNLTGKIVPLFAAQDLHIFVLLTKSSNVNNLIALEHEGRTVVSFSVNATAVATAYESGAPSPAKRIAAARRAENAGYPVRFRIDPIIPVPGWKDMYRELVNRIFIETSPRRITLGSLRYFPNVRAYAVKLNRDASVFGYATERTPCDGRFRVPFEQRLEIYRYVRSLIPAGVEVGLCKETEACAKEFGGAGVACNCIF